MGLSLAVAGAKAALSGSASKNYYRQSVTHVGLGMTDDEANALRIELAAAQREIESLHLRLANVILLLKKELLLSMAEHASDENFRLLQKAVNECPGTIEVLEKTSLQ